LEGVAIEDVHVVGLEHWFRVLGADEELESGPVLSAFHPPPVVLMAFESFGDQS
jgi:hypothetical protein